MREALLVGAVMFIIWFLEKVGGTPMVNRPIVISAAIGLVLGDVTQGIIIGAALELVFMGAIQVGAAVPPDVLVGAGLGTAFALMTNQGSEIALALALPIALLASSIKVLIFIIRSWFMNLAVKMAEDVNIVGMQALHWGGLILQAFMYGAVGFVAILFGSAAVETFVNNIPEVIMHGLEVVGGLLPAVGFALLLQPMMNLSNSLYFILGFVLIAYMELPILAITIFGVVLAFIITYEKDDSGSNGSTETEKTEEDELEALFDD
jgi:PTS system mannose-specific IIC component/fructoselysine and glucoselysine-specific PTS system IIC component